MHLNAEVPSAGALQSTHPVPLPVDAADIDPTGHGLDAGESAARDDNPGAVTPARRLRTTPSVSPTAFAAGGDAGQERISLIKGVISPIGCPLGRTTPSSRPESKLTVDTLSLLQEWLREFGIVPSEKERREHKAAAALLRRVASRDVDPKAYLYSWDPGTGKSLLVRAFVTALSRSSEHDDVGVLLCVPTHVEVMRLLTELRKHGVECGVLTGAQKQYASKAVPAEQAQVLITTQECLRQRTKGRRLADVEGYRFRGMERVVRIWDESLAPAEPVTLSQYALGRLPEPLADTRPALAARLQAFSQQITAAGDGGLVTVPQFGVPVTRLRSLLSSTDSAKRRDEYAIARRLWSLAGRTVIVRADGRKGLTLVSHEESLPPDILPLVVFDASGRVRHGYRLWEEHRGTLVRVSQVIRTYRSLTLHVRNCGSAKEVFKSGEGDSRIDAVAKLLNQHRRDEFLIVLHGKDSVGMDIEEALEGKLAPRTGTRHYLTWGQHLATNDYRHIRHIVLIGPPMYPQSQYEAMVRAAADMPADLAVSKERLGAMKLGETLHAVFQAACRGAVRMGVNGNAKTCDVYLMTPHSSGVPEALRWLFPGAEVVLSEHTAKRASEAVSKALACIEQWVRDGAVGRLRIVDVQRASGVSDPKNFKRDVRKNEVFKDGLRRLGVIEDGRSGYRLVSAEDFGFSPEDDDICVDALASADF